MALNYLTVQDMLWVNHLVAGKVQPFDYARLEEATYYQYGYGASQDLASQAAKFLEGYAKKDPFPSANEATGFVGFVAFLRANGHDLDIQDGDAKSNAGSPEQLKGNIVSRPRESDEHEAHGFTVDMHGIIEEVVADYPETIRALNGVAVTA